MTFKKFRAAIMLTVAALVWGAAMSFQSEGMEYVGPLTFQAIRFLLGGTVLLPLCFILGKNDPGKNRKGTESHCRQESGTSHPYRIGTFMVPRQNPEDHG